MQFDMWHLGNLKHFLGIDFIQQQSSMMLCQEPQYAMKLLDKARMSACASCSTPMPHYNKNGF